MRRLLPLLALLLWALPAQSQSQSAPQLATASNWIIGPIKREAAAKPDAPVRKFCSLKASFNNKMTLVMARDTQGGQTLALEFPGKTFAAGATLPLTLTVGNQQMPANGLAVSTTVLLLQAPQGGAIDAGIGTSAIFMVDTGQQQKAFAVGGIADAQAKLTECLATLERGEDFEPVKVPANKGDLNFQSAIPVEKVERKFVTNVTPDEAEDFNPGTSARNEVLRDEIRRLRQQNRDLMQQNQQLSSQLLAGGAGSDNAPAKPVVAPVIVHSNKSVAWPSSQDFSAAVSTYLATEAARCSGDFAHTMGAVKKTATGTVQDAEIACMGTAGGVTGDYAAALSFRGGQGELDVDIFQGPAGMIEQALQARAQIDAQGQ